MSVLTEAIAEAVRASDESAASIAAGAGVAPSQLSRLLSGERGLSANAIEKLADYLDLQITITPKRKPKKRRQLHASDSGTRESQLDAR